MNLKSVIAAVLTTGLFMMSPDDCHAAPNDLAKSAAASNNAFAWDIYAQIAQEKQGNLFLSPYSIESALAMTYAGARENTAAQMIKVLHLNPEALPVAGKEKNSVHESFGQLQKSINAAAFVNKRMAFELVVANRLWGQKGFTFNPEFTTLLQDKYAAGLEQVDFAKSAESNEEARLAINHWVEQQTKDKIKDLIGKGVLTADTRLVLTNAIYFKSSWSNVFHKESTKDAVFHTDATNTVDVPMMHQKHRSGYMENAELQMLEMPYLYSKLSMVIILPKKIDGLAAVEKSLNEKTFLELEKGKAMVDVEISLPKFKFTSQFGLSRTLQKMGMTDAFSTKADFSGMVTHEPLAISDVIHQAFVDVNEQGTEAAAATAVVMMKSMAMLKPEKPVVFNADHPFIFVIRDNTTSTTLFVGRVANPK